jgi:hypothetical protein
MQNFLRLNQRKKSCFILRKIITCSVKRLRTPSNDIYTPTNEYSFSGDTKNAKSTHFQGVLRHKKDRNPIFQGISVVLPKLYLGG